MPIFKNHRGQFHKMNAALVALTSLYVIGAAVALSSPYWASSYPVLAPLAAFAATPLGMGILAFVAIALTGLAICAIIQNNKISEEKAPKITQKGFLVRREIYEEMKENNKDKGKQGQETEGKYYMGFNFGDKNYRIVVSDSNVKELGNTVLLEEYSVEVKSDKGGYTGIDKNNLGLKQLSDEVNTYLGKLSSVTPAQGQSKRSA